MMDRGRDAADVLTATVGVGLGAKVRVGPLNVGIFGNRDVAGLRSATFFHSGNDWAVDAEEQLCPVVAGHVPVWSYECFYVAPVAAGTPVLAGDVRKKGVEMVGLCPLTAFSIRVHDYTQIEVAGGLGGTVRLGLNPGELLDCVLGWTTFDMFKDDIGRHSSQQAEPDPQTQGTNGVDYPVQISFQSVKSPIPREPTQ